MGIEQLVDSFMGNPAPLKAKVDRDNASQPPNEIPKDLEEAIALQKIANIQKGSQNQQAMQAGGAQPSVVQKLQQMLAGAQQRQQTQMQPQMPQGQPPMSQQPVMAAQGGSIDQLMSNLGRHYAGGGIVAFAPGGEIKLGTDFASFLQKMGTDYVEYANSSPEVKANLKEIYAETKTAAPAAGEAATVASKAAPAVAEGRGLLYGTGKLAGKAVKAAGLPGALASTVSEFGDYKLKSDDDIDTSASGTYSDLKKGELGRAAKGLGMGLSELGADLGSSVANTLDYVVPGKAPVSSAYDKLLRDSGLFKDKPGIERGRPTMANDPRLAENFSPTPTGPGAGRTPGAPVDKPVRPAGPPGTPVEAVPTRPETERTEAPAGLRAAIEANIRKNLNKDEDAEFKKATGRYEGYMGLDKLLEPKNARIAEEQALIKKIQGERLPSWVEGFSRASKPILSGGIGTMLNNLGSGMQGQREAYNTDDLGFLDKIGKMEDEVAKLKIDGKYKAAAAGEAAIKDAIDSKEKSEHSGTSLLNTDEQTAQRRQAAKDAALARVDAARLRAAGSGSGDKQQLAELKALQSSKTAQLKTAYGSDKKRLQSELAVIEAEIAKMAGISTMAPAPGAGSPGGTSKPGWGIKPI